MFKTVWDAVGDKLYELGIDRGMLYRHNGSNLYASAEPWNGLTSINEAPDGGEANDQYADNIKYASLMSAETFGGTINAFTYPESFEECDGSKAAANGVYVTGQIRQPFGLAYRTKVGNDVAGEDYGYKLHLVWGAKANPSDKDRETINESPEATEFSWEFTTTPENVTAAGYRPTSHIVIDTTRLDEDGRTALATLENILYGVQAQAAVYTETTDITPQAGKTYYTYDSTTETYTEFEGSTFESGTDYYELTSPAVVETDGRLPTPDEVIDLFA